MGTVDTTTSAVSATAELGPVADLDLPTEARGDPRSSALGPGDRTTAGRAGAAGLEQGDDGRPRRRSPAQHDPAGDPLSPGLGQGG